jgi:EAL domain-containing protein (putative c-di-GMP-specific phosphodiesterase class I)
VQLIQADIVHRILNYLEEFRVPPRLLEIEITETILMENVRMAIDSLERLHARGISIAIDDFGTGYSSLSYLKTLPIDSLKIDRGFIHEICTDENDQKIVQTLISMAHSMGMTVVAEGVETLEQYDLLRKYEVDDIQGNLLSSPVNASEIEALMQSSITIVLAGDNVVQMPYNPKTQAQ